jgi:two-component system response regulator HydG
MAESLAAGLAEIGYEAVALSSSREAAKRLVDDSFDALVTDLRMPELDGLELLKISRAAAPSRPVIVMTAYSAVESAIESIRQGAFHYLTKPFKLDELALFLNRALEDSQLRRETASLRSALRARLGLANVVGSSNAQRLRARRANRARDLSSPHLRRDGYGQRLDCAGVARPSRARERPVRSDQLRSFARKPARK